MRFSQKIGMTSIRNVLQVDSIDKKLENRLWNTIQESFFDKIELNVYGTYKKSDLGSLLIFIWQEFYGNLVDEIPHKNIDEISTIKFIDYVKTSFFTCQWFEKYDFLEFLSKIDINGEIGFSKNCNDSLKKEMSAYRLIDWVYSSNYIRRRNKRD